jgi:hypothetical protein
MKTRTYARLSLLIPILIWLACLLLLLAVYVLFPDLQSTTETPTVVAVVGMLLIFYAIGIIYWLIPYLLVSLMLLLVSFLSTEKVLRVVYFLSPILMAIVIMVVVTAFTITPSEGPLLIGDLASDFQDSIGTGGLFAIITLFWSYICVGLGFGIYKLLQHFGMIKTDEKINSEVITVNS